MKKTALVLAALGLTLGTSPAILAEQINTPAAKSAPATTTESGWSQEWQKLESDLDKLFRVAVAKLHPATKEQTFSSTVDVRETPDAYVARISVPRDDESKINVKYSQGALKIDTTDKAAGGFDESIHIPGAVNADQMKTEHKDGILVVTLPKAAKGATAAVAPTPPTGETLKSMDQKMVREMQRMEDRMDQLTQDTFRR
ncbi:MAG: Hsp20/alpha crystallin family protein, partial [Chthoniobacter sp.]|uniref:Hsp20/alpha crystallin family protein n=1 Tax=Chthoniobacter sp. TaxID=2510640 RepID=UPI0032A3199C